ncbi:hypothetical protein CU097_014609 [Rhizopus azygosporus]|uniref:Rho-GAP domain-containing protein n=1 Tax=Rhizopus azygosporus TaxID=86630 RepID=A0A367KF57_RHIAZ|nr:hypothetical protein CU097_014609 [Rhizopus azygosporus]
MHQPTSNTSTKKKHMKIFNMLFTKQKHGIDAYFHEGIFGVPLCDAAKSGSSLWDLCVPDPVYLCFLEICKRGLGTEGLFRLSGATAEVVSLENKINMCTAEERKLIDLSHYDIHTLTSLVKKYLRELPEPVIPNAFHEELQAIDLEQPNAIQQISSILIKLPFYNRQLIHAILIMAGRIQDHVNRNMMCPEALATVFAPVCTGFEHSLRDMKISTSSTISSSSTHSTFRRHRNNIQASGMIDQHIKRNKQWTNIWTAMIEHHVLLITMLDKQHYTLMEHSKLGNATVSAFNYRRQYHHYQNRTLPSPYSTSPSPSPPPVPPKDIIYPIHKDNDPIEGIPVVKPTIYSTDETASIKTSAPSLSKKSSFFLLPKSNTLRKILSTSTLR